MKVQFRTREKRFKKKSYFSVGTVYYSVYIVGGIFLFQINPGIPAGGVSSNTRICFKCSFYLLFVVFDRYISMVMWLSRMRCAPEVLLASTPSLFYRQSSHNWRFSLLYRTCKSLLSI